MKERKTIYCKEAEVWDRVVECAKEGDISISQLLLSPFQKSGSVQVGLGQINRLESKLDRIEGLIKIIEERGFPVPNVDAVVKDLIEDVIIPPKTYRDTDYVDRTTRGDMLGPRSDDEVLREAQDKLEKIQASRGYFNPQPKKGK